MPESDHSVTAIRPVNVPSPLPAPLPPNSTIGIVGGGQLGRMTALAAARLGYRSHILSEEPESPAGLVAAAETVGSFNDEATLAAFAAAIDVATFEFENVPAETAAFLAARVPVRPGAKALAIAQDRLKEKTFINDIGIGTAPFRAVPERAALDAAVAALGRPSVLKTVRLGYDGKGQVKIEAATGLDAAWAAMGGSDGILEGFVDFEREISVVVARGVDGKMAAFDAVENRHVNHILDTTIAPAPISIDLAAKAQGIARHIAESLDLVGLLAVEMFVTRDGKVLVNEIAPRPHNSGHWTMDACVTSQFEQFVRAVCGLPLGDAARHSDAVMKNLIGDAVDDWHRILAEPGAKLHLYGKREARPGRKMGHVNRLYPLGRGPRG
jgi:5-(carboxyamino)imidazole ribonucleotide synthase